MKDDKPADDAASKFMGQLKSTMEAQREYIDVMAQLTMAKYRALLKAGFTPEQALKLSERATWQ